MPQWCMLAQSASMSGQPQPSSAFQVPLPQQPVAARPGGVGEAKPAAGREAGGAAASEEAGGGGGGGRRRTARPRKTTRSGISQRQLIPQDNRLHQK